MGNSYLDAGRMIAAACCGSAILSLELQEILNTCNAVRSLSRAKLSSDKSLAMHQPEQPRDIPKNNRYTTAIQSADRHPCSTPAAIQDLRDRLGTAEQTRLEYFAAVHSFRVHRFACICYNILATQTASGRWKFCTSRIFEDVTMCSGQTENGLGYSRTWCFWVMTAGLHYPICTHVGSSQCSCGANEETPHSVLNSEPDILATANQRSTMLVKRLS
jgi:hypothetical protein